jgi:hypothetical protein
VRSNAAVSTKSPASIEAKFLVRTWEFTSSYVSQERFTCSTITANTTSLTAMVSDWYQKATGPQLLVSSFPVFRLDRPNKKSRRADSNR